MSGSQLRNVIRKNLMLFWLARICKSILKIRISKFSQLDLQTSSQNSILIIGPGILPIPPINWGGVEQVIFRQLNYFREHGNASVDLLNSGRHLDWIKAWSKKPKVVYCHYDAFAFRLRLYKVLFKVKVVGISHFGYSDQTDYWDHAQKFYVRNLLKLDAVVCLSEAIRKTYLEINPEANLIVIPNSISTNRYQLEDPQFDLVYLAKVEPRKQQFELACLLNNDTNIVFVGPISDARILNLSKTKQSWFMGPLTQIQLDKFLPKFKTLLLTSLGEGDAAVLYEAQACGLSILITKEASGAQNLNLPWIKVVELAQTNLNEIIQEHSNLNSYYRSTIANYARLNYDSNAFDKMLLNYLQSL